MLHDCCAGVELGKGCALISLGNCRDKHIERRFRFVLRNAMHPSVFFLALSYDLHLVFLLVQLHLVPKLLYRHCSAEVVSAHSPEQLVFEMDLPADLLPFILRRLPAVDSFECPQLAVHVCDDVHACHSPASSGIMSLYLSGSMERWFLPLFLAMPCSIANLVALLKLIVLFIHTMTALCQEETLSGLSL